MNAGRRDGELHAGAVIVTRVEIQSDADRRRAIRRGCSNASQMADGVASYNRAPIYKAFVVIEHANLGTLSGRLTFIGIALTEVIGDRRMQPRFVSQAAVDDRSVGDAKRA